MHLYCVKCAKVGTCDVEERRLRARLVVQRQGFCGTAPVWQSQALANGVGNVWVTVARLER